MAKVTYNRVQNLYRDSVVTSQRKDEVENVTQAQPDESVEVKTSESANQEKLVENSSVASI